MFENLLAPLEKELIDVNLLNAQEKIGLIITIKSI